MCVLGVGGGGGRVRGQSVVGYGLVHNSGVVGMDSLAATLYGVVNGWANST